MNYYDGEIVYEHLIYFCFVYDNSVDTFKVSSFFMFVRFTELWCEWWWWRVRIVVNYVYSGWNSQNITFWAQQNGTSTPPNNPFKILSRQENTCTVPRCSMLQFLLNVFQFFCPLETLKGRIYSQQPHPPTRLHTWERERERDTLFILQIIFVL